MRRWLFNLASALLLAFCIATVVLWVRGRLTWKYDRVAFTSGNGRDGAWRSNVILH